MNKSAVEAQVAAAFGVDVQEPEAPEDDVWTWQRFVRTYAPDLAEMAGDGPDMWRATYRLVALARAYGAGHVSPKPYPYETAKQAYQRIRDYYAMGARGEPEGRTNDWRLV